MMKIIFLDVDGVLNHSAMAEWENCVSNRLIDQKCVDRLLRIIEVTGAKIVLSSTWRLAKSNKDILLEFIPEEHFIGVTPCVGRMDTPRKTEILDWLQKIYPLSLGWNEKKIENLAVIDDDLDADLGDGSFFRTSFNGGGLTDRIANEVIIHLNKE